MVQGLHNADSGIFWNDWLQRHGNTDIHMFSKMADTKKEKDTKTDNKNEKKTEEEVEQDLVRTNRKQDFTI